MELPKWVIKLIQLIKQTPNELQRDVGGWNEPLMNIIP